MNASAVGTLVVRFAAERIAMNELLARRARQAESCTGGGAGGHLSIRFLLGWDLHERRFAK